MNRELITKSASYLKEKFQETPQVGLILGCWTRRISR